MSLTISASEFCSVLALNENVLFFAPMPLFVLRIFELSNTDEMANSIKIHLDFSIHSADLQYYAKH